MSQGLQGRAQLDERAAAQLLGNHGPTGAATAARGGSDEVPRVEPIETARAVARAEPVDVGAAANGELPDGKASLRLRFSGRGTGSRNTQQCRLVAGLATNDAGAARLVH